MSFEHKKKSDAISEMVFSHFDRYCMFGCNLKKKGAASQIVFIGEQICFEVKLG